MSKWECDQGHVLEGMFFTPSPNGGQGMPDSLVCPYCKAEMSLLRVEGANKLLDKIRDFIGKASENLELKVDGSQALEDLGRLESVVKRMADEAMRP